MALHLSAEGKLSKAPEFDAEQTLREVASGGGHVQGAMESASEVRRRPSKNYSKALDFNAEQTTTEVASGGRQAECAMESAAVIVKEPTRKYSKASDFDAKQTITEFASSGTQVGEASPMNRTAYMPFRFESLSPKAFDNFGYKFETFSPKFTRPPVPVAPSVQPSGNATQPAGGTSSRAEVILAPAPTSPAMQPPPYVPHRLRMTKDERKQWAADRSGYGGAAGGEGDIEKQQVPMGRLRPRVVPPLSIDVRMSNAVMVNAQ